MKGKYLRKIGGVALTALMLFGIAFVSTSEIQAQSRRRVIIVRPYPYRIYRPFGFGYRSWWGYPYGFGYDPYDYSFRYNHYVFDSSEEAGSQAYKDGFKTGKDDGKKDKSFDPQRSPSRNDRSIDGRDLGWPDGQHVLEHGGLVRSMGVERMFERMARSVCVHSEPARLCDRERLGNDGLRQAAPLLVVADGSDRKLRNR